MATHEHARDLEAGFFFVTLGEDCEKGLVLQGLAMGLRGNGEDGVEGGNVFVESPKWILALKTAFCKIINSGANS